MRMRILWSLSKPISSPGRTDKSFPPPLMRFLRSDVSSRSRGRSSRASPMLFGRKKKTKKCVANSTRTVIETTQEPSSPKVTCIGQVRVRRLSKSMSREDGRRKCGLCCRLRKPKWTWTWTWKWKWKWRWVCLFICRDGRARTTAVSSSKNSGSNRFEEGKEQRFGGHQDEFMFESGRRSSVSERGTAATSSSTPPKNAFLLTRCSSSSLASRFWGDEDGGEMNDVIQLSRFEEDEEEEEDYEGVGVERGRRSCASEMGTSSTAPPRNALLLTRSRSSSLASRFWAEEEQQVGPDNMEKEIFTKTMSLKSNRDSTSESRGDNAGSEESTKSVAVCAEEEEVVVRVQGDNQGGEYTENDLLHFTAVKNEEEGNSLVKLRRCKSEPARRNLEDVDPRSSEFWRLRRLSNAAVTSASHDVVKCY
ncbi:hypothetical protein vseg_003635 [Gypsophila vaccaria]